MTLFMRLRNFVYGQRRCSLCLLFATLLVVSGAVSLWRVGVAVLDFRFFRDVLFNFEYEVREV
jgi:hypothetical protein